MQHHPTRRHLLLATLVTTALGPLGLQPAQAQPAQASSGASLRIIVATPAGGASDTPLVAILGPPR